MNEYIFEQEFSTEIRGNSKIKLIIFEVEVELSKILKRLGYSFTWTPYYSKDLKHCIIEFVTENRTAVDFLIIVLERLNINYNFINPGTLEFSKLFYGINKGAKGRLFIKA